MINKSDSINELVTAMAKAQAAFKPAKKTSNNPYFSSKYADLTEVIEATLPALNENGLCIIQLPMQQDKLYGVQTLLLHSSGQWIENTLLIHCHNIKKKDKFNNQEQASPDEPPTPHTIGSCIAYTRRYSWQAICGLPVEDDDGNAASGKVDVGPKYPVKDSKPEPKLEIVKPEPSEENREKYLSALKKAVTDKLFLKSDIIAYAQSKAMCPAGKHEVSSLNTAALEFLAGRINEIKEYAEPEDAGVKETVVVENKPKKRQLTDGNPYTNPVDWKATVVHFGKWKNYTLHEMSQTEEGLGYLEWLYEKWTPEKFKGNYSDNDMLLEASVITWKQ